LRLSPYFNKQFADIKPVQDLTKKCRSAAVFIFWNGSVLMVQFHEAIHGKGFRQLLWKHGFEVYLIDEFKPAS
ncbi:hypothetical protein BX666DRAFT_1831073, partial [Dichotomocladium elegans]